MMKTCYTFKGIQVIHFEMENMKETWYEYQQNATL